MKPGVVACLLASGCMPRACGGAPSVEVAPVAPAPVSDGPFAVRFTMGAPVPGALPVDAEGVTPGTVEAEWSATFDLDESGDLSQGDVVIALMHAHSGGASTQRAVASFDSQVRVVARVEPVARGPARVAQKIVRRGLSVAVHGAEIEVVVPVRLPPMFGLGPDTPLMASFLRREPGQEASGGVVYDALPAQDPADVAAGRVRFATPDGGGLRDPEASSTRRFLDLRAVAVRFDGTGPSPGDGAPGVVDEAPPG